MTSLFMRFNTQFQICVIYDEKRTNKFKRILQGQ